jgi:lipoate synthase
MSDEVVYNPRLGGKREEVEQVLKDLRAVNCDRLAIGQYLKRQKLHSCG